MSPVRVNDQGSHAVQLLARISVGLVHGRVKLEARGKMKRTSQPRMALDPDFAAHQGRELRTDREAKAGAAVLACRRIVRLRKSVKNDFLFLRWYPNARVRDRKAQNHFIIGLGFGRDTQDHFAPLGELDCIPD